MFSWTTPEKEFWCLHKSPLMGHTWRKQSMILQLKSDKGKNQWHFPIKMKLRAPSIIKNLELILCTLYFIIIYLSLMEILKECLMFEHLKKNINMHKLDWKAQYFKSSDVSMLVHGCGISQYPQFNDTI